MASSTMPFSCSALLISGLAYKSHIIVLSIPAMKATSKPRRDALINGTAEIWMASTSLAIRAGRARTDDMEIISTSNPSLAKPPLSFAIHIDAMVPDVNKYAIRNGRAAAAWISLTDTIVRVKTKSADTVHRISSAMRATVKRCGRSILLFIT